MVYKPKGVKGAKSKSAAKPPSRWDNHTKKMVQYILPEEQSKSQRQANKTKDIAKKSADEKLEDLLRKQQESKQARSAKSKSAAKPPDTHFKRYVQRGVDTEYGRGRIGVPSPVLPYNDVSNDHFLNKSPF